MILKRIESKQEKIKKQSDDAICCIILIVFAPCGIAIRMKCEEDMAYYDDVIKLVTLRKNAAGPSHEISVPMELLGRVKEHDLKYIRSNTNSSHYTGGHYFAMGAGCGFS